jgi:uncharacterized protein YciI
MPSVVHCEDSSNARSERERSYDAHIEYLRTLRDRICFAGPLATADGARAQGDENLVGSLFVIDEPVSITLELMQGDPYVKSGVWRRVSVFEPVKVHGPWTSGISVKPSGRLYAALASAAGTPLIVAPAVLFGAELLPRQMLGEVASSIWRAVAIFSASSLTEARSRLVQETGDRTRLIDSWSLPISVGTWTRPVHAT